ncbi:MAG TPA: hypothetical protein VIF60_03885 [Burkholderiaceae bacterium]|jgi:hypothetical protein
MFGISAVILTNTMLDGEVPGNYPVKIIAHWQVHGKSVSSHIRVSAWGPHRSGDEMIVSSQLYYNKTIGDFVCIHLHDGAYRMPWYTLAECRSDEIPDNNANP